MTARSESKVKVARWLTSIFLFSLLSFTSQAQVSEDLFQMKVTVIGHNMHVEDVLEQLTLQTKMQFIYSSSVVALDKPITLMARQQSLKSVLDQLAKHMNISFKKQGDYFVIKRSTLPTFAKTQFRDSQPRLANADDSEDEESTPLIDNTQSPSDGVSLIESNSGNAESNITKDLLNFGDGLSRWEAKAVKEYLPLLLAKRNPRSVQKKWFVSTGLFINDYGFGIETQAGIPLVHAVLNASIVGGGIYRIGYGLESAFPVKPGLTANLAYTFASMGKDEVDNFQNKYRARGDHHQARMMANISLSDHFSVRVGPTFNVLKTTHEYIAEQPAQVITVRYRAAQGQPYLSPSSGYSSTAHYQAASPLPKYETGKFWVGFEAGVAYRINFSLRK